MNLGIVALLVLIIVIVVGFIKKLNVGLLAMAAAIVIGYVSGQFSTKEIVSGFGTSLFVTLLGVTLLFGIISVNGCLDVVMKKIINIFGKRVWFIPILIFIVGWLVAALAGGFAALTFVCALCIPIARNSGYDPILLMIIGNAGGQSGRYTQITADGNIVASILAEQGIEAKLTSFTINLTIGMIILAVIAFIYFKGYRVKKVETSEIVIKAERLNIKQWIALAGIIAMIFCVVVLKKDAGLVSVVIAIVLILMKVVDQKEAFQTIPWNTIIMVTGMGMLMNLVIISGGIDILVDVIAKFTNPVTAKSVSLLTAGFMSWFSSTLGVVVPTLVPTVGGIVDAVGGNITEIGILSAMIVGSSCAAFSPASSVGGLILSTATGDPHYSQEINSNKVFVTLFIFSVGMVVISSLLAMTGIYSFFG